jgi:hypothetical protein
MAQKYLSVGVMGSIGERRFDDFGFRPPTVELFIGLFAPVLKVNMTSAA